MTTVSTRVLYQQDNVKAIMPSSLGLVDCNITIYDNKTIQILKQRQSQEDRNKSSTNIIKLRQIITIDLSLLYSLKFIQNVTNSYANIQIQWFQPNFIITNLENNQRFSFYLNILQCRLQKIRKCLSTVSWVNQKIWDKYQIVHQIVSETSIQNRKKPRYLVLKDTETFHNYYVKLYKRSSFIKSSQRRLNIQSLIHQIQYQNLIRHRHIMRYSKFIQDGEYFYLFYQQKPIKLFSQYIQECKQLSPGKIRSVLKQLLKVIQVLSLHQILHNNIKASSIFVIENNDGWKVCLGEFQHASHGTQAAMKYKSQKHKCKAHLAPQLLQNNEFYRQFNEFNSDVFSLGLLFHEMLFKKPFSTQAGIQPTKTQNEIIDFCQPRYQSLSTNCLDLFKQMIEFDPNFRTTAKQALYHLFFTSPQNLTDTTIQRTYNSFNTLKSYDTSVDRRSTPKISQLQSKRIRNRYYETFPVKKFLPVQDNKPKTQKSQKRVKINQENEIISTQPIKEKFTEALIDEFQMDDSHNKLAPRDVRTMKTALISRLLQ